jgi:hypothetical protein
VYFGATHARGGNGDVVWADYAGTSDVAVRAGEEPDVRIACLFGNLAYTVDLVETPQTPASFSGATSPSFASKLVFTVPGEAEYIANVTLSQGRLTLDGRPFAASGKLDLGVIKEGRRELVIGGESGPQARWTIAISATPVTLTNLKVDPAAIRPARAARLTFSSSGALKLRLLLVGPSGRTVRTITPEAVGRGDHSLSWDGKGEGGGVLRDGKYKLRLEATDPSGNDANAETGILVDGTGPAIKVVKRSLRPRDTFAVTLKDALSKIASGRLLVDRQTAAQLAPGQTVLRARPATEWKAGRHEFRIVATDDLGNERTLKGAFVVRT